MPVLKYPRGKPVADFYAEATRRIKGVARCRSRRLHLDPPAQRHEQRQLIHDRRPRFGGGEGLIPTRRFANITPEYFSALKVPLLQGRFFNEGDQFEGPGVIIVNNALREEMVPESGGGRQAHHV